MSSSEKIAAAEAAIKKEIETVQGSPLSYLDKIQADNLDNKKKEAHLDGLIQDRKERKKYATLIYWLIVGWLIIILIIIFFTGFKLCIQDHYFELSDTVLITLITTTTANIAAFFLGVVRYLFPNKTSE